MHSSVEPKVEENLVEHYDLAGSTIPDPTGPKLLQVSTACFKSSLAWIPKYTTKFQLHTLNIYHCDNDEKASNDNHMAKPLIDTWDEVEPDQQKQRGRPWSAKFSNV